MSPLVSPRLFGLGSSNLATVGSPISNLEKDKKISKDFERDYIIEIQELTDKYIKTSEMIVSKKIDEISEV